MDETPPGSSPIEPSGLDHSHVQATQSHDGGGDHGEERNHRAKDGDWNGAVPDPQHQQRCDGHEWNRLGKGYERLGDSREQP